MMQNVIELSNYQHARVHEVNSRIDRRRTGASRVLAAIEAVVTAVIGLCILFCMGLTITML